MAHTVTQKASDIDKEVWLDKKTVEDHVKGVGRGTGKGKSRLVEIPVNDLQRGLFEASAKPVGNYRTSWIMKLKREPGKCKLPRGFGYLSGKNI